jgi:hypothetical protein
MGTAVTDDTITGVKLVCHSTDGSAFVGHIRLIATQVSAVTVQ